ncbi:NAD-dependent epimerase/dehydratase family protein [Bradyrhizobium diazoefficiens]
MPTVNVLVTGASGFIGAHLVARLLSEGSRVTVLTRSSSALPPEWHDRISVIACDDFTETGLRRLLHAPFDTVFHLAAYGVRPNHRDIDEMIRINVELPATLVRLCTEWRARMIMAGTFSEYRSPSTQEPLTEDSPLEQGKLYGSSKAAGGLMASAIAKSNGADFRLLRLFKVYGAGEAPHRLLPALVSGLTKRERVAISAGTQILDFVYIDDVIEAMLRADSHCRDKGGIATWNAFYWSRPFGSRFRRARRGGDGRGCVPAWFRCNQHAQGRRALARRLARFASFGTRLAAFGRA